MAEYFYNKYLKQWKEVGRPDTDQLSPEKINDLRNARKNKKFIILKNDYPGINSTHIIYMDVKDVKLILKDRLFAFEKSYNCTSMAIRDKLLIMNKNILKYINEDYNYVSVYIDKMHDFSNDVSISEEQCKLIREKALDTLTTEQRLFYETCR